MHLLPATTKLLPDACFAAAGRHGISVHQLRRVIGRLNFNFFNRLFHLVERTDGSILGVHDVVVNLRVYV